jgi:hypothetical protein
MGHGVRARRLRLLSCECPLAWSWEQEVMAECIGYVCMYMVMVVALSRDRVLFPLRQIRMNHERRLFFSVFL